MSRNQTGGAALALLVVVCWQAPLQAEDREAWDAIYIGATKVGHTHIKVGPVKDGQGRSFVRVQVNTVLSFKRGKDRVNMEVRYGTIETSDGQVLKLDTRSKSGQDELRTSGEVANGKMRLVLAGSGDQKEQLIDWGDDVRGPYAAELSLTRQPMKPGESREVKTFVPDLNQICVTHLEAKEEEDIALGGGVNRKLLRVESRMTGPDGQPMPELDATLWVDAGGQIMKSHAVLLGGMDSYRTLKANALEANGDFDIMAATIIRITRSIQNPENSRFVRYKIDLKGGDPAKLIPRDQRQHFESGESRATLVVQTDSPSTAQPAGLAAPGNEFLLPNPLINCDDNMVVAHSRKAVGALVDPWEKSKAITSWVAKNIKKKNFGNAFESARAVARKLEGDCTEHAVLTAAMCRAAGVPSRMVVGLVYAPPLGGFGPHAWNEVFVNGRWVAIDSAFNQTEVDSTHIKLADSSLDGVAPFETFMPVIRIFNKLELDPIEMR